MSLEAQSLVEYLKKKNCSPSDFQINSHACAELLNFRSTPLRCPDVWVFSTCQSHGGFDNGWWLVIDSFLPLSLCELYMLLNALYRSSRSMQSGWCSPFPPVLCPSADDQISVKVDESGWAWMVCGERLIIWKICQTAVAKVQSSRSHRSKTLWNGTQNEPSLLGKSR